MAGNNIPFALVVDTEGANYRTFINALRARLTDGTQLFIAQLTDGTQLSIPVLHQSVVDSRRRFILIDLTNYGGETITVAIDVVNVYVVAYRVDNHSYFLRQDDPTVPVGTLFGGTTHHKFKFTGGYTDLERSASRQQVALGPLALDTAITNLRNSNLVIESLLVIIQTVSEAARFRYIETQIRQHMETRVDFTPDLVIVSLENNWGHFSKEIQHANDYGYFNRSIEVRNIRHERVQVGNINSPIVRGIVLLRYAGVTPSTSGSNNSSSSGCNPSSSRGYKPRREEL